MVRLSVNVNKVATLRNARGGRYPSVIEAVQTCIDAGSPGITVHPRADQRHITPADVREIARVLRAQATTIEYNIEGDPRPDLLDLDLANLSVFRDLPFLDEVSIGHAIVARALFVGLTTVVREYLDVLAGRSAAV